MYELIADIVKYMWKEKSLRVYLINMAVLISACFIAYFYINTKHNEAMATIQSLKASNEINMGNIDNKLNHITDRVDTLYDTLIDNR